MGVEIGKTVSRDAFRGGGMAGRSRATRHFGTQSGGANALASSWRRPGPVVLVAHYGNHAGSSAPVAGMGQAGERIATGQRVRSGNPQGVEGAAPEETGTGRAAADAGRS